MAKWTYIKDNREFGPLSSSQLQALVAEGVINEGTQVKKQGDETWYKAKNVKGLFENRPPEKSTQSPLAQAHFDNSNGQAMPVPPPVATPNFPYQPVASMEGPLLTPSSMKPPVASVSGRNPWTVPALVLAGAIVAVAYLYLQQRPPSSRSLGEFNQVQSASASDVDRQSGNQKADSDRNKQEELELKELRKQRDDLESQIRQLEDRKKKTQSELDEMTGKLAVVRSFVKNDIALFNPTHCAVGIEIVMDQQNNLRFRLGGKVSADTVSLVRSASFKSGLVRIGLDPPLARDIFSKVEPGEMIDEGLSTRLLKLFHGRNFVPINPDEPVKFVCFQSVEAEQKRCGYYVNHNDRELIWRGFQKELVITSRDRIEVGTCRVGSPRELLEKVEDLDFLDYSLLEVARHLGTSDGRPRHVALTIRPIISVNTQTFIKELQLGVGLCLGPIQISASGSWVHDPKAFVRSVASELEDRIYARLNELGVPVLEREHIDGLLAEHALKLDLINNDADLAKLAFATHILFLDVTDSNLPATVRYTVRLAEAATSKVVWASESYNQSLIQQLSPNRLHLASGKLVAINPSEFKAAQAGYGLYMDSVLNRKGDQLSRVAYLEDSTGYTDVLAIRDLFNRNVFFVEKDIITQTKHATREVRGTDDVPPDNLLRYVIWRIYDSVMPRAGRVTSVDMDRRTASVDCNGANRHFLAGDRLYGIRPPNINDTGVNYDLSAQLPLELIVRKVDQQQLEIDWGKSEIPILWADDTDLRKFDFVYKTRQRRPVLDLQNFCYQEADQRVLQQLLSGYSGRSRSMRYQEIESTGFASAQNLQRCLMDGLERLDVPILGTGAVKPHFNTPKATHLVKGIIRPTKTKDFFEVKVLLLESDSATVLTSDTFILHYKKLASWRAN